MKQRFRKTLCGTLAACALATGSASATVVNFDGLTGSGPVPAVHRGIGWDSGWYYLASAFPPFEAHSSPTRIYSDADVKGFAFLDDDQIFDGAWFAGYYYASFQLYNDGLLVHTSQTLELFGNGPARFLASGYAGLVDAVSVIGIGGGYVMDDVTYHGEVPEPDAPSLMLAGMLAAALLNLRMKGAEIRKRQTHSAARRCRSSRAPAVHAGDDRSPSRTRA